MSEWDGGREREGFLTCAVAVENSCLRVSFLATNWREREGFLTCTVTFLATNCRPFVGGFAFLTMLFFSSFFIFYSSEISRKD